MSGYVLFGVVSVERIPMDNLEVIRGNKTKELMGRVKMASRCPPFSR